jgi:hypothetical protein
MRRRSGCKVSITPQEAKGSSLGLGVAWWPFALLRFDLLLPIGPFASANRRRDRPVGAGQADELARSGRGPGANLRPGTCAAPGNREEARFTGTVEKGRCKNLPAKAGPFALRIEATVSRNKNPVLTHDAT